jgi:ABC-2 type transport system ATP-binding protein
MVTKNKEKTQTPRNGNSSDNLAMQIMGVTKRFGSNVAVNDVTFNVRRGEVVGFLGPNGSGKSTTMRLITSFYTPDSGRILIEGIDNQQHDKETRSLIGYLPENNPLYGDLLVKEYLEYVADIRGLSGATRRNNMDVAVEETGIQEVFYKPINTCSKGYRQRTGIAGAILHQPNILIMDEPTEGLDPNQRVPVRELIRKMGEERTVMLSTHVLQEVEEVCDRLLIIRQGKIVAQGTPDDLRRQAVNQSFVIIEVEGDGVEKALDAMDLIESFEADPPRNGRRTYKIVVKGLVDIRPELFKLAKTNNWMLWELHREAVSLGELFRTLTADDTKKIAVAERDDNSESEVDENEKEE